MRTVYDYIINTLTMATFKITSETTVAELKEQYRNEVGGTLRIYNGRSEADDGAALVSLGAKEGVLECRTSRTVGSFEKAFQDELGLKVKVYTKDNWVKVLDGITLESASKLPNGMTKAKMEEYVSNYSKSGKAVNEEKEAEKEEPEIDVNDGWDASEALASETNSVAYALHKLGDGYDDEAEQRRQLIDCAEDYLVILKKDGVFKAFQREVIVKDSELPPWEWKHVDMSHEIDEADEVFYAYRGNQVTTEEVDDIEMDGSQWPSEDDSICDAIIDALSTKEYEWPEIDVDFIYNGKVFYSFTL